MTVHLPIVLLLLAWVWFLIKKCGLKPLHALLAMFLGFLLSESSLAPAIRSLLTTVQKALEGLHL
ncbi:hypothetical protein [Streptomyces sp. NPDC045470]|uniref:hypothetical protein n=1 Tax=Streptomyces sp. NPDC045470 TaxID=3155469 RepID=UPI003411C47B